MPDLQSLSKEELFQYMEEIMRWDNACPKPKDAAAQAKLQPISPIEEARIVGRPILAADGFQPAEPKPRVKGAESAAGQDLKASLSGGNDAPLLREPITAPNPKGGPRTSEGKAKSSLNNLQHGLTGSFRIVGNETQEEFDSVVAAFTGEHQPATATELVLVEKMAEHLWLFRRAQRLQDFALTEDDLHRLSIYMRYQTTNDRAFHKSLNELKRLQKERRKFESQNDNELERDSVKSKVRLANARANHLEIDAKIRQKLDIPSENSFAVPFQEAQELFTRCLVEMAAKLSRPMAA